MLWPETCSGIVDSSMWSTSALTVPACHSHDLCLLPRSRALHLHSRQTSFGSTCTPKSAFLSILLTRPYMISLPAPYSLHTMPPTALCLPHTFIPARPTRTRNSNNNDTTDKPPNTQHSATALPNPQVAPTVRSEQVRPRRLCPCAKARAHLPSPARPPDTASSKTGWYLR